MTDIDRGGADVSWARLRRWTAARIGLARTGASIATAPLLDLRLAHARARDAVHAALDAAALTAQLEPLGLAILRVDSAAVGRREFLMRPDLGRKLADSAADCLRAIAGNFDLVIVISDGLSARAVQSHAVPLLTRLLPQLIAANWAIAPLVIVRHGRVAVGDAVAGIVEARAVVVLLGERPGLSSPDSLGAYVTWAPSPRSTDADRNCVSNIRPEGNGSDAAAFTLAHLLSQMRARRHSGVRLKDESGGSTLGKS